MKALPTASVFTRILNRSASLATHRSHRPCRQGRTHSQQAVNTIAGAALLVAGRCRCAVARGSDMPDPMHGSDSRGSLLSHIRSTARRPVRGDCAVPVSCTPLCDALGPALVAERCVEIQRDSLELTGTHFLWLALRPAQEARPRRRTEPPFQGR